MTDADQMAKAEIKHAADIARQQWLTTRNPVWFGKLMDFRCFEKQIGSRMDATYWRDYKLGKVR